MNIPGRGALSWRGLFHSTHRFVKIFLEYPAFGKPEQTLPYQWISYLNKIRIHQLFKTTPSISYHFLRIPPILDSQFFCLFHPVALESQ
jgi:hypothetical protein